MTQQFRQELFIDVVALAGGQINLLVTVVWENSHGFLPFPGSVKNS